MSPAALSSLKWGNDGEPSSQDTSNWVIRLTKVEEQTKASNLLYLSSKHSHGEQRKNKKTCSIQVHVGHVVIVSLIRKIRNKILYTENNKILKD